MKPDPRMPRDLVVMGAPLYPGSIVTSQGERVPLVDFGYTKDIKSIGATATATADVNVVSAWYRKAFRRCGFTSPEYGSSDDKGVHQRYRQFVSPSLADAAINVYYNAHGASTSVHYAAFDVTVPPRPTGSMIDANEVATIHIAYQLSSGRVIHREITNRTLIQTIVSSFDSLKLLPAGEVFAGAFGPMSTFKVVMKSGHTRGFRVEPWGVMGKHVVLADPSYAVENALGMAVYAQRRRSR